MNQHVPAVISVCLVYMIAQTASHQIKAIRQIRYDEDEFHDDSEPSVNQGHAQYNRDHQRDIDNHPSCDCISHNVIVPTIAFYQLGGLSIGNEFLRQLSLFQHQKDQNDENASDLDRRYQQNTFGDHQFRSKFRNDEYGNEDDSDLLALDARINENQNENFNQNIDDEDDASVQLREINSFRNGNGNLQLSGAPSTSSPRPMFTPQQWIAFIDALSGSRNSFILNGQNQHTM